MFDLHMERNGGKDFFIQCFLLICLMVFNATFCSIVTVSFIGGGNRRTRRNHRSVASH